MAHGKDWLPAGQDAFVDWSQHFVNALEGVCTVLGIASTVYTQVKSKQTAFMSAWTELQLQEKTHSTSVQRKTLTDNHRKYLRDWFNQYLRYNPGLTNDFRAELNVPIPDTTHTPIVVGDHRVGFDLLPEGPFVVGMKCWDIPTGEKKILYGMSGIVVLYAVSDKPLTTIAELTESALITKVTHRFSLADTQRGQWLSVSCCWQSETGERGADSPIESTIVP